MAVGTIIKSIRAGRIPPIYEVPRPILKTIADDFGADGFAETAVALPEEMQRIIK